MMKRGFTLAELLIVIGILCLLFASISPLLRGNQDQAMLSRQADIVRQTFYETVMKAKTGAVDGAGGTATMPLRGFLLSTSSQEVGQVTLPGMSLENAQKEGLASLMGKATKGQNLLYTDIGHASAKPLAKLESISLDANGSQTVQNALILFEAISNETLVLTDNGVVRPEEMRIILSHPQSPRMTRPLAIQPGAGLIYPPSQP